METLYARIARAVNEHKPEHVRLLDEEIWQQIMDLVEEGYHVEIEPYVKGTNMSVCDREHFDKYSFVFDDAARYGRRIWKREDGRIVMWEHDFWCDITEDLIQDASLDFFAGIYIAYVCKRRPSNNGGLDDDEVVFGVCQY